ncbi:hypothetical protein BDA99DRAFT_498696 [Phascolomyces articulosus]|uniref:K Homology domain-containing protein n=1 Tax=Phascolomyces articulosus TaxID=60185 RepID=A0AAD5K904_9FUNG|nr:hypothetical protein BDA99DRAFT_498696 [Phascolomyces articulosus]
MNNQQQPGNYSAMPPPPSLTGNNAPVNFNDALSKARAIAEKLKSQNPTGPTPTPPAAGMKRNYREDSYEEEYEPQSSSYRDGDYYDDQRDAKRGMYNRYESTSSRPRYGLGSEERKSSMGGGGYGAYGTNTGAGNEGHIQDECSVPNHMVGLVIGKGGDSLKKIERMSGAKVQIGPDMQEAERKVKLTGEEDQVKIARDMIQQIVDDGRANEANKYPGGASSRGGDGAPMSSYGPRGGNNYNNDNNQNEGTSMMVPAGKVGLIIGRGGENIRNLEGRSGAKITIVTDNHSDRTGGERCVNISGDTSAVQQAKSLIDEIITDEAHNSTSVAPSRDWNAYRQQHYQSHGDRREGGGDSYGGGGYGGRGGNNDGQDSYGGAGGGGYGRGRYNNDGRYNNNEGRYNNNDRYNNDDEEGEKESVQVPQNAVGFIIGRRGDTVRALQDQSGARIKVDPNGDPNAPERTISIFGKLKTRES